MVPSLEILGGSVSTDKLTHKFEVSVELDSPEPDEGNAMTSRMMDSGQRIPQRQGLINIELSMLKGHGLKISLLKMNKRGPLTRMQLLFADGKNKKSSWIIVEILRRACPNISRSVNLRCAAVGW